MFRHKWGAWLWYAVWWCPCYAISQVFFRFRSSGKNYVPMTGPVLLVSNHQSNLDPVLVGVACPRQLKYLAKQGLFFWPLGAWIRALGAVPINQEGGALAGIRAALELLKQGNAVLIFPEGSRTENGQLQEMRAGVCLLARRSRATIVPVALDGAYAALPRGAVLPRQHAVSLVIEAPIAATQYAQLSDAELMELVTKRIEQAFARTQRELTPERAVFRFTRPKHPRSLLAGPLEPTLAGENNI